MGTEISLFFLLVSIANPTPTPTFFALASLAFSFACVNREAVNTLVVDRKEILDFELYDFFVINYSILVCLQELAALDVIHKSVWVTVSKSLVSNVSYIA